MLPHGALTFYQVKIFASQGCQALVRMITVNDLHAENMKTGRLFYEGYFYLYLGHPFPHSPTNVTLKTMVVSDPDPVFLPRSRSSFQISLNPDPSII